MGCFGLGLGMLNIVYGQEQLVIVTIRSATVFRAPIYQNTQDRQVVILGEKQNLVVQHVCRCDRVVVVYSLLHMVLMVTICTAIKIDNPLLS